MTWSNGFKQLFEAAALGRKAGILFILTIRRPIRLMGTHSDEEHVIIRKSSRSPKVDSEEIRGAVNLLTEPVDNKTVHVFDAMPRSFSQIRRVGVSGSLASWKTVTDQITTALEDAKLSSQPATKQLFVTELAEGSANVIVLFAHNAAGSIAFSTGHVRLSPAELRQIRREKAPQRAIVLAICGRKF